MIWGVCLLGEISTVCAAVLTAILLIIGGYFSYKTNFFQIKKFKFWNSEIIKSVKNDGFEGVKSLFLALGGTVGVGNIAGVATATVISQILSATLILIRLIRNQGLFSFKLKGVNFSWRIFGKMVVIGLPAGVQSCAFNVSNAFLQSGVNSFGNNAIEGSTAVATIENLLWVTLNSFVNAATTFVSQNVGAGKLDRARKSCIYTVLMTACLGLVIGITAYLCGDLLLRIFIDNNELAMEYGRQRYSITFPFYFLAGIMGVLPGAIRGFGSSLPPSIITLIGACGIRVVWVYTVFKMYPNLTTLYLVHPITWIVTVTALTINLIIAYKQTKKKIANKKLA